MFIKTIQARKCLTYVFGLLLASTLVACGGGGGGGAPQPTPSSLQGTWLGAYQIGSTAFELGVDVGANGQITDIRQDGGSLGVTGTIAHVQGNIFSFTLSDGTEGGFMTDSAAAHAGFVDEFGSFGVLQKGATALPTYVDADVVGNWSGYSVELDTEMNITASGNSSGAVSGTDFTFSGTDMNGPFSGAFSIILPDFGAYLGGWSAGSESGNTIAWLSVDRRFAASWACIGPVESPTFFPECTFAIWNKP